MTLRQLIQDACRAEELFTLDELEAYADSLRKENMNALQIRNLNVPTADLDDLVLAKQTLALLDSGYQAATGETPEWVTDKLTALSTEIDSRVRDQLLKTLKTKQARRSALATPDEKRERLDAEIAALQNRINPPARTV